MDTLSLNKYQPPDTDRHGRSDRSRRVFIEFFINDAPLSSLLDKFYNTKSTILDNWIGVLGTTLYPRLDLIKVNISWGRLLQMRRSAGH